MNESALETKASFHVRGIMVGDEVRRYPMVEFRPVMIHEVIIVHDDRGESYWRFNGVHFKPGQGAFTNVTDAVTLDLLRDYDHTVEEASYRWQ